MWLGISAVWPHGSMCLQSSSQQHAVSQNSGSDLKQSWWHIADNALLLPEYLVQLTCHDSTGTQLAALRGMTEDALIVTAWLHLWLVDVKPIWNPGLDHALSCILYSCWQFLKA